MKEFKCSGGMKISQSYNIHEEGFNIIYDKNGNPIFECRVCGNRYNINAIVKRYNQIK